MTKSLEHMSQEEAEERLPELFSELDEQRLAEESHLHSLADAYEKKNQLVKRTKANVNYPLFYSDWQRLHINERDYEADCDKKTKSLLRFHKFKQKGRQPILDYSCEQIGHLYLGVLKQSKKYTGH